MRTLGTVLLATSGLLLCAVVVEAKTNVIRRPFGKMPDGTPVEIFTMRDGPVEARITTYGGIVVSFQVPDRTGKSDDVVLGFDNFDAQAFIFTPAISWTARSKEKAG